MSNIGKRVWKAIGTNYILSGVIIDEKIINDWLMVKIDWFKPHHNFEINEWQKFATLGKEY